MIRRAACRLWIRDAAARSCALVGPTLRDTIVRRSSRGDTGGELGRRA